MTCARSQREHRAKTARFAEERGRVRKGMWKLAVGVGLGRECLGLELVRMMRSCLQVASSFFFFPSEVGGWVIPAGERGESRREVLKRPSRHGDQREQLTQRLGDSTRVHHTFSSLLCTSQRNFVTFCGHAQPGMKMLGVTEGSRAGRRSRSDSIGERLMEELDLRSWLVGAWREAEESLIWENWGH